MFGLPPSPGLSIDPEASSKKSKSTGVLQWSGNTLTSIASGNSALSTAPRTSTKSNRTSLAAIVANVAMSLSLTARADVLEVVVVVGSAVLVVLVLVGSAVLLLLVVVLVLVVLVLVVLVVLVLVRLLDAYQTCGCFP